MSAKYNPANEYARIFLHQSALEFAREYTGEELIAKGFEFMPGFLPHCQKTFPNGLTLITKEGVSYSVEPRGEGLIKYTVGRLSKLPGFDIRNPNSIDQLTKQAEQALLNEKFVVQKICIPGIN